MGYKKYLKLYMNETRMANIPNADFVRADRIHFNLYNSQAAEVLIGNFRVAEGGKKILYDALMADGRVATRGIYFDSGSDQLRPESTPTLKQMGQMLQEHQELSLLIEGHTDDQGDDSYNQDLSERRAAAVRQFLIAEYGISDSRLQSKGFGESNPVSPNTTPEGRQNNRRVELVKL
jgi:outer membrane protein OmpA-like peptidoglycan-associated protein